ncbi:MAG: DUF3145 family protein [Actinobacteria bacterium]|nr:DUF3145 family protein [Actinomycetota bacterium]
MLNLKVVGEDESSHRGKAGMMENYIGKTLDEGTHERSSRGVVYVHAVPKAVSPHVEWAVGRALGTPVSFEWRSQPLIGDAVRTEFEWQGPFGAGSLIASSLIGWSEVRFEVTEMSDGGRAGERWVFTPSLGSFHVHTDEVGNYLVSENVLRSLIEESSSDVFAMRDEIDRALGGAWDRELETFRNAGEGAPVTWLHRVG